MADLLTLKKFETLSPFEIKDELIKLAKDDYVVGARVLAYDDDVLIAQRDPARIGSAKPRQQLQQQYMLKEQRGMKPIPVTRVGPSARGAMAASVCAARGPPSSAPATNSTP